jgi:hypothetical protein
MMARPYRQIEGCHSPKGTHVRASAFRERSNLTVDAEIAHPCGHLFTLFSVPEGVGAPEGVCTKGVADTRQCARRGGTARTLVPFG